MEAERHRHCQDCGATFAATVAICPSCRRWWRSAALPRTTITTVALLNELDGWANEGLLTEAAHTALHQRYEARLPKPRPEEALRFQFAQPVTPAARRPVAAAAAAPSATASAARPGPFGATPRAASPRLAIPPRPPKPPRPPREGPWAPVLWASRRQADLLLYLGAFLLSVAAIIFVNYQGSVVNGAAKTSVLGGYTVAFLALGLLLRRWERVREAGPVFVGLGAILTPLNFVMLWIQVLSDRGGVSQASVWFAGSSVTCALTFWLTRQGFGRVYLVPAAVSALVAWGSLAATVHVPIEWGGAWFALAAAAINVGGLGAGRRRWWFTAGALAIGVPAVAFSIFAAAAEDVERGDGWELPVTLALAFAGVVANVYRGRATWALAVLPALGAGALGTAAWAADLQHLREEEWHGVWFMMAAWGYVVAAGLDRPRTAAWGLFAAFVAAAGITVVQSAAARGELSGESASLAVTYGMAFIGALAAWAAWRRAEAAALLPALLSATVAAAVWSAVGFDPEWIAVAVAAGAAGYLVLEFVAPTRTEYWRGAALAGAVGAITLAHFAAPVVGTSAWPLPVVYAVALAAALWTAAARRDERGWFVVPLAYTGAAMSFLWARDIGQEQWAWAPLSAALAVALSEPFWRRQPLLSRGGWAYSCALALGVLPFISFYIDEPAVGAGAFATAGVAWVWAAARTRGGFAALLRLPQTAATLTIERQLLGCGAGALGLASLAFANRAFGLSLEEGAWAFAVAGAAAWLAGAAFGRRWSMLDGVFLPVGLGAVVVAISAASGHPDAQSMIAALAAGCAALAIRGPSSFFWRAAMVASGLGAIGAGHAAALVDGTGTWQLPAAYGVVAAALLWDAVVIRYEPSWLGVPAVGALGLAAFSWWQGAPPEHWAWPALGFGLAIVIGERAWRPRRVLANFGWPYGLLLALSPLPFLGVYLDAPEAGAAALALSSLTWLVASLRTDGAVLALVSGRRGPATSLIERQLVARGAGALLGGSLAYLNRSLGLSLTEGAWAFAAAGVAAWLASGALGRQVPRLPGVLGPIGASALVVAAAASLEAPAHIALMLGAAAVAAAFAARVPQATNWQGLAFICGAGAIAAAHVAAGRDGPGTWELPAAYGLVLAAAAWDAVVNRTDESWLFVPALATMTASSWLWSAGISLEQWAWPALGAGLAIAASERWWTRKPALTRAGWPYVLVLSLAPIGFLGDYYDTAAVGAAALAASAALWGAASARSAPDALGRTMVRVLCGVGATMFLFGAAGFANKAWGFAPDEGAWTFVGIATAAWLAMALAGQRARGVAAVGLFAALVATLLACGAAGDRPGEAAIILAISSAGAAVSIAGVRRWPMLYLVAVGSALSLGLTWVWGGWSAASLGLAYAGVACASALALTWWRDWKLTERSLTAALVPLGWLALALVTGVAAVAHRAGLLPAGESIQTTGDWAALTVIVALAGALGVAEGLRLRTPDMAVATTPLLMLALEMAIAMLEPASLQAYTTPLGCYVIALSMVIRRSEEFIGPHLYTRELVTLLGVSIVVLPGAAEALQSSELRWSLLLIGEALVLLAVGFAFGHRWLVVSGVLTMVGVAARYFTTGEGRVPYWVTLAVVGMALLGIGVLLLGAREWWDRQRARISHWWMAAPLAPDISRPTAGDGDGLKPA